MGTDDCPILAFDSNIDYEVKTMFVLSGDEVETGNVRDEVVVNKGSGKWGAFNGNPIHPLGSARLDKIIEAFNSVEPLHSTNFDIETMNCFHFVQDMWRHLDLKEDESLMDFLVENIVQDEHLGSMLAGVWSTDSTRKVAHGEQEYVKNYIRTLVQNQLDF